MNRTVACLALFSYAAIASATPAADAGDPSTGASLLQRVQDRELDAVAQALDLVQLPTDRGATLDALRVASGRCTRFVLALTSPADVKRVCSSVEAWPAARTARELRRRMATIDADAILRTTKVGKACRAAYAHELRTTRVVLRSLR